MTERPPNRPQPPAGLNLSLGDVYHILFRHKWKILLISGLGLFGSVILPLIKKVPYSSEAKLYIRYVVESSTPTPDTNDPRIRSPETRGDSIINTELEILTSLDLAQQVADTIGVEKILGPGPGDRFRAAAIVRKSLTAEMTKNSPVIRLTYQHNNPDIVQPILQQIVYLYAKKHTEIHAVGAFDDFLTQETDQLRSDLSKTEQELGRAKTNLGYYASLEDAKKFQGAEISRIRQSLFEAEAELAERKAAANELVNLAHVSPDAATSSTNKVAAVPAEKFAEYKRVLNQLDSLYKREQDDSLTYTPESTWMNLLRKQITNSVTLKQQLEKENPGLIAVGVSESKRIEAGSNPRVDFSAEAARVLALNSKIAVLNEQLERLQKEAATVSGAEGTITKLQLQKEIEEGKLKQFVKGLEQVRIDEKIGSGKFSNITRIQEPSPPFRDVSKLQKVRMAVAVAGFAFAVGLAFLLEMFVDRSVKHAGEIEGKLGLPLFLSVPLIHQNGNGLGWLRSLPLLNHGNGHGSRRKARSEPDCVLPSDESNASDSHGSGLETYDSQLPLRPFFEALRDRLISFFEIKNLTHKPKLVAVTSCREGSGVSTFASGLAASLSETGDGNVLLVDMCQRNGAHRQFLGGHLNCGLDEVLESEKRNDALVQDNLYVVSESGNGDAGASQGKLARILPKRFTNLMPKLKASDYDYIIFDMPPINQLSVTPRIAKFMDIVLLVIESEKTDRDVVKRAVALLAESKPNLGAVLNKRRTYVPKILQQDL
jgi:succinoglycan biosynthesis transport protein ExoP